MVVNLVETCSVDELVKKLESAMRKSSEEIKQKSNFVWLFISVFYLLDSLSEGLSYWRRRYRRWTPEIVVKMSGRL